MLAVGAEIDHALVARAQTLADDVLFPAALATDASPLLPVELLHALASAGFYGLSGRLADGGLGASAATAYGVIEALASGCLTTTFVWLQHLGSVRAVSVEPGPRHDQWAAPLCAGTVRAGVAFAHLRRPDPPMLTATPEADGGWRLDGTAPWITGWGRIDVIHVAARHGDDVVWLLVDAREGPTLRPESLRLAAINASGTVVVHFDRHVVDTDRVTSVVPLHAWLAADAMGLRANGSLALGVASRSCRLLRPSRFDAELAAVRDALDRAEMDTIAVARAAATDVALRVSAALVAEGGGRSITLADHAQRLAREALFLVVQGQNPAIRRAQVELLQR